MSNLNFNCPVSLSSFGRYSFPASLYSPCAPLPLFCMRLLQFSSSFSLSPSLSLTVCHNFTANFSRRESWSTPQLRRPSCPRPPLTAPSPLPATLCLGLRVCSSSGSGSGSGFGLGLVVAFGLLLLHLHVAFTFAIFISCNFYDITYFYAPHDAPLGSGVCPVRQGEW